MKYLINIVFIMCFGQIFAQSTFYYQHNTPYSNESWDIVELEYGYIICGTSDKVGFFNDGFLMKLDKQGNVLWDKIIEAEKIEEYRAVVDVKDGFVLGGFRWIDGKRRNLLVKYDYDGNKIWDKIIGDTLVLGFDNFVQDLIFDKGFMFMATAGFDTESNSTNAVLIKLDLGGNIIWKKNYGSDLITEERADRLNKINKTGYGFLLHMSSYNGSGHIFNYILGTDNSGNEIWRKNMKYYDSPLSDSDTIIYFKDFCSYKGKGSIAYFVRYDLPTNTSNHILVEFDEFGNEIEFREYPPTAGVVYCDIHSNKDNELFLIGQQDLGKADSLYYQLFSAKFDCNKNLIWEHHYGEKYIGEFQTASTITSDGGVFIGGRIFNITSFPVAFNSILVKTDCRGLLEWDYESCIDPKITQDVLVFPNPFDDYINIHLPNVPKENEIGIQIFDLKGSLVKNYFFLDTRVIKLNTADYSSGFYVVRIFVDGEIYHSEKIIKVI